LVLTCPKHKASSGVHIGHPLEVLAMPTGASSGDPGLQNQPRTFVVLFADVVSYPGWSLCCVGCSNKVGEGFKDYEERSNTGFKKIIFKQKALRGYLFES
jgi:hypothetical protein